MATNKLSELDSKIQFLANNINLQEKAAQSNFNEIRAGFKELEKNQAKHQQSNTENFGWVTPGQPGQRNVPLTTSDSENTQCPERSKTPEQEMEVDVGDPKEVSSSYGAIPGGLESRPPQEAILLGSPVPPSLLKKDAPASPATVLGLPGKLEQLLGHQEAIGMFPLFRCESALGNDAPRDQRYLQLPCEGTKPRFGHLGTPVKRWELIQEKLSEVTSVLGYGYDLRVGLKKLHSAIKVYGSRVCRDDSNYQLLVKFPAIIPLSEHENMAKILQAIINKVLLFQQTIPNRIPILGRNQTIVMTQEQAFAILANAFLCTFPQQQQNSNRQLQSINFYRLFDEQPADKNNSREEKLKCIVNYFKTMRERSKSPESQRGTFLTFEKRSKDPKSTDWGSSKQKLCEICVKNKTIEEGGRQMLQVDFANKLVGGGVLGNGALMEEIRFSIFPELIVSILFTEELRDTEVLVVTGCEQFSKYRGYGHSFKFDGKFYDRNDSSSVDMLGRLNSQVVAMDALQFTKYNRYDQFSKENINRELNKCFSGFSPAYEMEKEKPIASGSWGCGAFNGDPHLKFLIQWMAASQAGRKLTLLLPDKDEYQKNKENLEQFHSFLQHEGIKTVGQLYRLVQVCGSDIVKHPDPERYIWASSSVNKIWAMNPTVQAPARPRRKYYRKPRNPNQADDTDCESADEASVLSGLGRLLGSSSSSSRLRSYDLLAAKCGVSAQSLAGWAKIRRIRPNCPTHANVIKYIQNSRDSLQVQVLNIYKVERVGENQSPFGQRDFRMVLWHGTHPGYVGGIIQNGFKTGGGGLYGAGIYLADRFAKSAPYCGKTVDGTAFLFLCEASLGKVYKAHHTHSSYTSAPPGFHTVKGNGSQIPKWRDNEDYHGAVLPCGPTTTNTRHPSFDLAYNEYIVYDPARVVVRMLVECKF